MRIVVIVCNYMKVRVKQDGAQKAVPSWAGFLLIALDLCTMLPTQLQ